MKPTLVKRRGNLKKVIQTNSLLEVDFVNLLLLYKKDVVGTWYAILLTSKSNTICI